MKSMNKTKRLLGYSIGLTVLYVVWLLPGYWNLGFTIINSLFLVVALREFKGIKSNGFLKTAWLLSLGLGGFMAIRSFWFVRLLSLVSILVLDLILTTVGRNERAKLDIGRLIRTNLSLFKGFWQSFEKLFSLVSRFKDNSKEKGYKKIVVGILMSIPLLFVFGGLFYSADPIFAKIIDAIKLPTINFDERLVGRILSTCVFFGVTLAVLRNKLAFQIKNTKWLNSITETNVAVLILEVLFVVFCAVQIKYFLATPDDLKKLRIIFSEYTREGYGQMIVASILAYLVVLRLEFSLRSQTKLGMNQSKLTKFLTWAMIGEIFILIVSATKRNYVYQSFYGFTEIRLLGFALSLWLVVMLGLLAYKVWKKRKTDFFTRGIILTTVIAILGLNIFDIDGTIVRTKPASLDSGVDYFYMVGLSDDAWQGWEKIVADAESKANEQQFEGIDRFTDAITIMDRLDNKIGYLEDMANNHWGYGGSFNYSNMNSLNYLQKNKSRIKYILSKLKDKRQQSLYRSCLDNIYKGLRTDFGGKVWMEDGRVLLKVGAEMGPSEEAMMFSRVDQAAYGVKWSWYMDKITENNKPMRVYKISCVK